MAARKHQSEVAKIGSEIDALITKYHALLLRTKACAIGAIYCRYSSKNQHSIADQVRSLLEKAVSMDVLRGI